MKSWSTGAAARTLIGGVLAWLLSGTAIVEQVLGLPTLGPLYISATMEQDVYLSGTILILQFVRNGLILSFGLRPRWSPF